MRALDTDSEHEKKSRSKAADALALAQKTQLRSRRTRTLESSRGVFLLGRITVSAAATLDAKCRFIWARARAPFSCAQLIC